MPKKTLLLALDIQEFASVVPRRKPAIKPSLCAVNIWSFYCFFNLGTKNKLFYRVTIEGTF